jgi:hypothetical protein
MSGNERIVKEAAVDGDVRGLSSRYIREEDTGTV